MLQSSMKFFPLPIILLFVIGRGHGSKGSSVWREFVRLIRQEISPRYQFVSPEGNGGAGRTLTIYFSLPFSTFRHIEYPFLVQRCKKFELLHEVRLRDTTDRIKRCFACLLFWPPSLRNHGWNLMLWEFLLLSLRCIAPVP